MTALAKIVSASLIVLAASALGAGSAFAQSPAATPKPAAVAPKPAATTTAATAAKPAAPALPDLSTVPKDLYMWVKMCTPDAKTNKDTCLTMQRLLSPAGDRVLTASLREVAGDPKSRMLMVTTPLGVVIEPGVKASVDKGKVIAMKYAFCAPDGCYAQGSVDDLFMKLMKTGSQLKINLVTLEGKEIQVPLTLTGFSKVYADKGVGPDAAKLRFDILAAAVRAKGEAEKAKLN